MEDSWGGFVHGLQSEGQNLLECGVGVKMDKLGLSHLINRACPFCIFNVGRIKEL